MTNPLMDRKAPIGGQPSSQFDYEEWCDKMNSGHESWGSDKFFFYLPSNRGGFYPKSISYRSFGSSGTISSHEDRQRAIKYYRAAGVPDDVMPAIFERASRDHSRWKEAKGEK